MSRERVGAGFVASIVVAVALLGVVALGISLGAFLALVALS